MMRYLNRHLDYIMGIPLVFIIGLYYRIYQGRRKIPTSVENIGLMQIAKIGDTVLMSAVWHDLCKQYPATRISVLVGETNYEIASVLFGAENIILLPVCNPIKSLIVVCQLKFDVVIDFGPWPRWNALLTALIPAKYRIGYNTKGQYRHFAYDLSIPHSASKHEIENQRALTKPLGVPSIHLPLISKLSHSYSDLEFNTPFVIFHPWAAGLHGQRREWSFENWVDLAQRFSLLGMKVYVSGAPSESEKSKQLVNQIKHTGIASQSLAGKMSLLNLIFHLSHAAVVVSVNTGIMHIAAATGTLTVALNGPTNAKRWGPIGLKVISIETPCKGCGFLHLGFEYPITVPPCMEAITVDMVWDKILDNIVST